MRIRSSTRFVIRLLAVLSLAGCRAEIPVGIFACQTARDCPSGFVCHKDRAADALRCYAHGSADDAGKPGGPDDVDAGRTETDGGAHASTDAGASDAGHADGGTALPSAAGRPTAFSTLGERRAGNGLVLYDDGFEVGERLCTTDKRFCVTGGIGP